MDERKDKIEGETLYRELILDRKGIDQETRVVPASLSSEIEVPRWFGREVLVHDADSADLSRAAEGLPMLFGHNHESPIGLAENVRLDAGVLRADLRFSNNSKATEVWNDVREGFLKNISIGYQVRKWEENDLDDIVRVTDWQLLEASVVTVPADASIGINRGQDNGEGKTMTEEVGTRETGKTNVLDYQAARDSAKAEGIVEGQRAERARIDQIEELFIGERFKGSEYQGLRKTLIDNGDSIETARSQLLKLVGSTAEPATGEYRQDRPARGEVQGGETDAEKFAEGMSRAIMVRVGTETDKKIVDEVRENEFVSMTIAEMAREYLRRNSVNVAGMSRDKLVGTALTLKRAGSMGHSTSDFDNILENIAGKALLMGYDEAPETWASWCRSGSLSDFKQASRTGISAFSDLDLIYESGEYKFGNVSDLKETLTLLTYGKMFNISRQALVNDDLNALGNIPRAMGRAASRKVGDLAYGVLTANAALNQDSTTLFHADHSNYIASGSGAAPSVATVDAGFTAMATQTDPSTNATLNIMPSFLLVPHALRMTADILATAAFDPTASASLANNQPNPFQGRLQVVADARLDSFLATGWYLAANPNTGADTVEVAFLDGQQAPYLEQKDGWNSDGVEYKVRIDAVAGALDFRGLYYNYGA